MNIEKKIRRYQRIIIGLCLILCLISACSPAPVVEIENNPEPDPTATPIEPTETEEIIDTPTPVIDVSGWIVTVGSIECSLESFGDELPGWYMADCPEQLWFPIRQTTPIEINLLDSETCTVSPIDDFETAIQGLSKGATAVEFIQLEDGQWGCYVPYSDTAGIEVTCGFGCEGEEVGIILNGKTIRNYSGGGGESNSSGGDHAGESGSSGGGQAGDEEPPPDFQH